MKLYKAETKKQLTVADLKRGEIGTTGDGAAVFNDGAIFQGIQIDNGYLRAVIFTHGSFLNATYPVGSKLVLDFANNKIEVLPPNEEPDPQLTTGDLKPGQIGEDSVGNLIMRLYGDKYIWLGQKVPSGVCGTPSTVGKSWSIVRILPPGTLLEVE